MPETSQKYFDSQGGQGGRGNRGNRGDRGDSFLRIYILGIFGGISSNFSLDRCQKPPKIFFDSQGARGTGRTGGTGGTVSLKSTFLVFLVIFLQT